MIRKFSLILGILFLKCIFTLAQANKYLKTEFNTTIKSEFYLYLAKQYNQNAYAILTYKNSNFTQWSEGKYHLKVLNCYGTVVHEACHYVNHDLGWFNQGYFISPEIQILVPKTKIFKSCEIDKNIPKEWKINIFRYTTYMLETDNSEGISSVSDGIYGLVEEFDAYYQCALALVELYGYYITIANYNEPYYWINYLSKCYSQIFAYHEFRLFIAWYLKYSKKNYPEIYKSIIQNKNLKIAFTLIDKGYQKVIEQYFTNRKLIIENINKAGNKKASLSDRYLVVISKSKNGPRTMGYAIPDKEISYLNSIFTIEDFQMLKLLTIDNLTETNYKSFIE